jgi:hypothetical protein
MIVFEFELLGQDKILTNFNADAFSGEAHTQHLAQANRNLF